MSECLVVWPVRHHDYGFGLGRDVLAVFMTVVDEQFDLELVDQFGLFLLSEMDHRIVDAVSAQPIASDLVDIVGVTHPAVGDENDFVFVAYPIERLPLDGRWQRRED